jgi:N-acetylneuraminic acid mutarotase
MRRIQRFALLLLLATSTPALAGQWTRIDPVGPAPAGRTTPAVAAVGSDIYLFSGVHDDFATFLYSYYDDLWRFDTASGTWSELFPTGAAPPVRTFAAAAADGAGRMLVFGGSEFDAFFTVFIVYGDLWAYDPGANSWTELTADNAGPEPRSGANLWVDGNTAYVFGGITQFFQTKNDLWAYDLAAHHWTELIPDGAAGSPPPRHIAATGKPKQGRVTVYGGEGLDPNTFEFSILEDVWQLDLATQTWSDVTPSGKDDLAQHRNYGASAVIGQKLLHYGGDIPGGSSGCGAPFPQNVSNALSSFQLQSHRWRSRPQNGDAPPPLKRTAGVEVDGSLYVLAGWDFDCDAGVGPGQTFNQSVYAYGGD